MVSHFTLHVFAWLFEAMYWVFIYSYFVAYIHMQNYTRRGCVIHCVALLTVVCKPTTASYLCGDCYEIVFLLNTFRLML